jgi:hypothetical protein
MRFVAYWPSASPRVHTLVFPGLYAGRIAQGSIDAFMKHDLLAMPRCRAFCDDNSGLEVVNRDVTLFQTSAGA